MKRITLSLTDDEYLNLEHYATVERRSVREMCAYLVVKNTPARPNIGGLTIQTGTPVWQPSVRDLTADSTLKIMN